MTLPFKMVQGKSDAEGFTDVPIVGMTPETKGLRTKKYIIITLGITATIVAILIAILVGMHMFTEAQKEIVKFTVNLGDKVKQDVQSDPNANVVTYHVTNPGQETWTMMDFNKGIEVVKVTTDSGSICYVKAVNKSLDLDPSKINKDDYNSEKEAVSLTYTTADEPISDSSFLPRTAREICNGIKTYWVYPRCGEDVHYDPNITALVTRRKKRDDLSEFKLCFDVDVDVDGLLPKVKVTCCVGCCSIYCSCEMTLEIKEVGGRMLCTWYYKPCDTEVNNPYPSSCYKNSPGLVCPDCKKQ